VVTPQRMVTCIFCGLWRPGSDEDVISKWIRRTLNPATEVIIRAEPTGAVSRLQYLTVTLEDMVCQQCNNTWMSRLENRGVKPFLAPMLTNEDAVTLDETQQRDLARWAVIKWEARSSHCRFSSATHVRGSLLAISAADSAYAV
jgi:hypothetical protein